MNLSAIEHGADIISYVELQAASTRLERADATLAEYNANFLIGIDNEIRNAIFFVDLIIR